MAHRGVAGIGRTWTGRSLLDLWRAGAVRPRVDGVYPFEEAAAAHRRIGGRRNIDKVVLVL
jgi:NADPH:quinone reductase-like Zn-dependent oxidoreductase